MPGKYIGIKSHPVVDGVLTEIDSIKTKKFKELPKQISKKGSAFWMAGNEKTLLIRTRQGAVNRLKIGGKYNTDYFDHCLLYIGEAIGRMEQLEADKKLADAKQEVYQTYEITLPDADAVNAFVEYYTKQAPCEKPIHTGIGFDFIEELKAYKYNPKTHNKGKPPVKIFEIDDYVKWGTPLRAGKIIAFTVTHNDALIKSSNGDYSQVRLERLEHAEKPIKVGDYVKTTKEFNCKYPISECSGEVIDINNYSVLSDILTILTGCGKSHRINKDNLEHADKPKPKRAICVGDTVRTTEEYNNDPIGCKLSKGEVIRLNTDDCVVTVETPCVGLRHLHVDHLEHKLKTPGRA